MISRRGLLAAGLTLPILSSFGFPAGAADTDLNLYAWADYFPAPLIAEFEQATGIHVNYDVFDSNETLEAKLSVGNSGYDIVVPNASPHLARQIPAGFYQPLDMSRLGDAGNLDPAILRALATVDPGNRTALPWMWGSTGLGYERTAILKRIPDAKFDSLALLFDPKNAARLADCGINLIDLPGEVIPAALMYLGRPPYSDDPADLEAAADVIRKIRPFIRTIKTSGYPTDLADGTLCLAFGYSGDMFLAAQTAADAKSQVEIGYSIPVEGIIAWIDTLAIPRDAPHVDNAYKFLDFLLQPASAAAATNYGRYANANAAATALVDPAIRDNPGIYPPDAVRAKFALSPLMSPEYSRTLTRLWTTILAASN